MAERLSRAWIESRLSLRERNELFESILEETSSPTGEQILEKIRELFPRKKNLPSVGAIIKWKSRRWDFVIMLHDLRKTSEEAREVIAAIPDDIEQANRKLINEILFRKLDALKKNPEADDKGVQEWILAASKLGERTAAAAILKRKAKIMDAEVYDAEKTLAKKKEADLPQNIALRRVQSEIRKMELLGRPLTDEQARETFQDYLEEEFQKAEEAKINNNER